MIVIDVFAKVRAGNTKNTPLYEADYGSVVALQELAIEPGIAVVLTHHDRKLEAEDPFNTVSGTLGLTGAADHPDPRALGRRGGPCTRGGVTPRRRSLRSSSTRRRASGRSWATRRRCTDPTSGQDNRGLEGRSGPLSVRISCRHEEPQRNRPPVGKMALDGEIDRVGRGQYTLPQTHRTGPDATSVRH
jgi:hypothetical protein